MGWIGSNFSLRQRPPHGYDKLGSSFARDRADLGKSGWDTSSSLTSDICPLTSNLMALCRCACLSQKMSA
jgi:hypothetical protein